MGWDLWNLVSTVGAFMIATSIAVFMVNAVLSVARGKPAGADPWDARTLEWSIPSPPPHYNFAEIPTVRHRDEVWHRKYAEDESGRSVPVVAGAAAASDSGDGHEEGHEEVHIDMPNPSYWPIVAAAGMPLLGYGLIFHWIFIPVGVLLLLSGLYGWKIEPVEEGVTH
jgi:cytochrome c oxidase subunit 1